MSTATRVRTRSLSRERVATIAAEQRHRRRPVRLVTRHRLCPMWRNQVWPLQLHLLLCARHRLLLDRTGSHSLFQCFLRVVHTRRMVDRKHHLRLSHSKAIVFYSMVCGAVQTLCQDSNQIYAFFFINAPIVKALYDYTATIEEEFDFQAGDVIAVTATPDDGWWSGELLDEARRVEGRNVFPSNFVCLF